MRQIKHYRLKKDVSLTENDVRTMEAIKAITSAGESAEVKRKADGGLTVYRIRKEIATT